jgi:hypothetical protein
MTSSCYWPSWNRWAYAPAGRVLPRPRPLGGPQLGLDGRGLPYPRILSAADHRLHHVEPWAEQRADDPLYVAAIVRVRESLGRRGLLYVGDCKMGALETRSFIQACGDANRGPLSAVQRPPNV